MNNKRIRTGLIILLLVISSIAVTACGGTSPLVGKWQIPDEDAYIEFFKDGQFEMGTMDKSFGYSGTYEETGDKEVTLALLTINGEDIDEEEFVTLEYSISGDELMMDDGETPITFIRVD